MFLLVTTSEKHTKRVSRGQSTGNNLMCKSFPDICQIVSTSHTHAVFCLRPTAARGNYPRLTRKPVRADSSGCEANIWVEIRRRHSEGCSQLRPVICRFWLMYHRSGVINPNVGSAYGAPSSLPWGFKRFRWDLLCIFHSACVVLLTPRASSQTQDGLYWRHLLCYHPPYTMVYASVCYYSDHITSDNRS